MNHYKEDVFTRRGDGHTKGDAHTGAAAAGGSSGGGVSVSGGAAAADDDDVGASDRGDMERYSQIISPRYSKQERQACCLRGQLHRLLSQLEVASTHTLIHSYTMHNLLIYTMHSCTHTLYTMHYATRSCTIHYTLYTMH
jgi:hypothetical protein